MSDIIQTGGTMRPTTSEAPGSQTEYVVLRSDDKVSVERDDTLWRELTITGKVVTASSADAAIRKAAGEEAGQYVAVPRRSWQPRTLTVKTEKKVSLQ